MDETIFNENLLFQVGLIDEIGTDKSDCVAKCESFINEFQRIPRAARVMTKHQLRNKDVAKLEETADNDIEMFVSLITLPKTQDALGAYFASLKKK